MQEANDLLLAYPHFLVYRLFRRSSLKVNRTQVQREVSHLVPAAFEIGHQAKFRGARLCPNGWARRRRSLQSWVFHINNKISRLKLKYENFVKISVKV